MPAQVTITVSGRTGSGRSTIAKVIADALAARGFKPVVEDDDPPPPAMEEASIRSIIQSSPEIPIRIARAAPWET